MLFIIFRLVASSATVNWFSLRDHRVFWSSRVLGHAQVAEDQSSVSVQAAHFFRDAGLSIGDELDCTDCEAA